MSSRLRSFAIAVALACSAFGATSILAQQREEQPKITEETPYVITPTVVVDTMLKMAGVHSGDFLIDLGSGDGRIVITAARRFGTRGFGVDYDPRLVRLANDNARKAGVADRVSFIEQNLFSTDISQASVITMYLLPEYNLALQPRFLALKPGTRIVSHDYGIGDWKPDMQVKIPVPDKPVGAEKASLVMFWVVPANVNGAWNSTVPDLNGWREAQLQFRQHNQEIAGTVTVNGRTYPMERASLVGPNLTFRVEQGELSVRFNGVVNAGTIAGQVAAAGGREYRWRALRK
ncbi:MAG: class I SAM-dependent methyltransferase [Burkholderiales bacterium]|nr:class I SAM-dependent methyltransferase [Burkholderiales bacterium]